MTEAGPEPGPAPGTGPGTEPVPTPGPERPRSGVGAWVLAGHAALVGLLLAPLVGIAYFVRPASDDWCLIPLGRDGGVSAVVADIYEEQNGRFVNALVNGLVFAHYPQASKLFPGLVLVLLVLAVSGLWALLLRRLTRTPWEAVAVGAALGTVTVAVMLLAKPAQYQTLFHTPTIVSHTLTVLIAATIAVVAHLWTRLPRLTAVAVFLGSAVLGTFNEAFTAASLVVVVVLVVAGFLVEGVVRARLPLVAGAGLLAGFVSVYLSPGSRNRQQLIRSDSVLDPGVWTTALENWWVVTRFVLTRPESLLLVVAAVAVGLLVVRFPPRSFRGRSGAGLVVLPLVGAVLASWAATFVLSYAFGGQLRLRERIWPSITFPLLLAMAWVLVVAASATVGALGRTAAGRAGASRGAASRGSGATARRAVTGVGVLALMVLAGSAGLLRTARDVHALGTTTITRAIAWDAGDRKVRREVAAGARTVYITPVPIDGLYEPFYPNTRNLFPKTCVPGYYGVGSIRPAPVQNGPR